MSEDLEKYGQNLLTRYVNQLADAKTELAYWQGEKLKHPEDPVNQTEIEKWLSEIEKYTKAIEEFLKKTPVGQDELFATIFKWLGFVFEIAWEIIKKLPK